MYYPGILLEDLYEPTNISVRKSQVLYFYFIFPEYDTLTVITQKRMLIRGSSHMPQRKRPLGQLHAMKDVQYKEEGYVLLSPVIEKSNTSAVF